MSAPVAKSSDPQSTREPRQNRTRVRGKSARITAGLARGNRLWSVQAGIAAAGTSALWNGRTEGEAGGMTPRVLIEPARLAGSTVLRVQTDERLVDLVRAGNDRAFEAIVHRYRRPLVRFCSRVLPPVRAED